MFTVKISLRYTLCAITLVAASACRERPKQTQADVSSDRQFAVTSESPGSVLGLKSFEVCSLENIRTVSDNSSNPGDAPNSWSIERGQAYEVSGFAIDKARGKVPRTIRLVLVGKRVYALSVKTGLERPDVGKYFARQEFSRGGYSSIVAFDDVEAGDYQVLVSQSDENSALICRTFQTITIQ
jgi:hypothetical protein